MVYDLDRLRARRTEILKVAGAHGAHNVAVFGSVARGDATATSDVDLLVELDPDRTVLDLSTLILDLQETLGCAVHVVEITRASRAAEQVRREAVAL